MRILISGASGFIGSAVSARLRGDGHAVVALVRRAGSSDAITWDPAGGSIDQPALEGFDAVIHLAGESIAGGRWTAARKARIRDSRIAGTRTLVQALLRCQRKPAVLLSASAIGFYGDRGDEILDEGSAMGEGFLAEVCRDWEAETRDAMYADIRVAHLRTGIVLGKDGGALPKMLLPIRLGVGGRLGNGRQFMSFIAVGDLTRAVVHALTHDELRGPVNLVGPAPVDNAEFTRTLGRVLRRPTLIPMPAFALRLGLGELADALLLGSQRVLPARLTASGFRFDHPTAETALRAVLA